MFKDGTKKLHILSDFDRTLTKEYVDGKKINSLISILRDEGYLTEDYPEKAKALFAKYHSIEIDHNISISEKKKAMHEWWVKHFELLIKSWLNIRDIEKSVRSNNIIFRKGLKEFLDNLKEKNIPFVVLSSSGLGINSISLALERDSLLHNNTYIVCNDFEWDEEGNMIGYKEPVIHVFNKDETILHEFPFYEKIKERKNVILLGDSIGDLGMVKGFDYDNLITIGFYNELDNKNLDLYREKFDVVITGDADFEYVNKLLKRIIKL